MPAARFARLVPPALRPAVRRRLVRYRALGLRGDDALLVSYPKSGSTWLRFLLAHALTGAEADFDSIRDSVPPLGRQRRGRRVLSGGGRLVRSHEPLGAGTPRPAGRIGRVVYLVRDGRDVALSYLAHERRYQRYDGDVAGFLEEFLAGRVDPYGTWSDHVLGALRVAERIGDRFLLVRYEQLRAHPAAELARVLRFLGRDHAGVDLESVVAANGKERMRAKEAASTFLTAQRTDGSPFVRPDRAGGWAEETTAAQRERFAAACGTALAAAGYAVSGVARRARAERG